MNSLTHADRVRIIRARHAEAIAAGMPQPDADAYLAIAIRELPPIVVAVPQLRRATRRAPRRARTRPATRNDSDDGPSRREMLRSELEDAIREIEALLDVVDVDEVASLVHAIGDASYRKRWGGAA